MKSANIRSSSLILAALLAAGMITSCGWSSETVQDDGQTAEYTTVDYNLYIHKHFSHFPQLCTLMRCCFDFQCHSFFRMAYWYVFS